MKHKGCTVDFTAQRNKELMSAFRRVFASVRGNNIHHVFELVVNEPCSRFWVSEERATAVISAMLRGHPILETMLPNKQEMFQEIYSRSIAILDACPERSLFDVVFDVVNSPAPKFYMTPTSAMVTFYKIKKGHYQKRAHRSVR